MEDWVPGVVVAALSLAVSARTAYRQHQMATLPHLHVQPLLMKDGTAGAAIHNGGKGLAKSVFIFLAVKQEGVRGHVGTGFLVPGEELLVETNMPAAPDDDYGIEGFVWCLDQNNVKRAWSTDGRKAVFRTLLRRRKSYPSDREVFKLLLGRSAKEIRGTYGYAVSRPRR